MFYLLQGTRGEQKVLNPLPLLRSLLRQHPSSFSSPVLNKAPPGFYFHNSIDLFDLTEALFADAAARLSSIGENLPLSAASAATAAIDSPSPQPPLPPHRLPQTSVTTSTPPPPPPRRVRPGCAHKDCGHNRPHTTRVSSSGLAAQRKRLTDASRLPRSNHDRNETAAAAPVETAATGAGGASAAPVKRAPLLPAAAEGVEVQVLRAPRSLIAGSLDHFLDCAPPSLAPAAPALY
jgi:hypothetical protein